MGTLIQLPPEILHNILSFCDPEDLAALPLACRYLHGFVAGNNALCQAIYLRHLDEPPAGKTVEWEQELHDLVKLRRICAGNDPDKKAELPFVYETFTRILGNSSSHGGPRNIAILAPLFSDERNRDAFLCRSFLFERARGQVKRFSDPPKESHQMSAKLHSLYGMPVLRCGGSKRRTRSSRMYPFACSKVYDLRQYTDNSRWGPFMNDGSDRVDWEKIEAILMVLRNNIRCKGLDGFPVFANFWDRAFAGSWPGSYAPRTEEGEGEAAADAERSELDSADPYGVSGTWLRVVCFLDYNDFFTYNFPIGDQIPDNVPRPALDIGEATRLILMKIQVTKIEPPGDGDGQALPVVYFKGFSRSLDGSWDENANSDLRGEVNVHGTCRLTPEGEVRWTTWSIFSGQERWRSESVQVGGVRSARGVVGSWFDKDYDPHGPCGPTAFWKIGEGGARDGDQQVLYHDFLPLLDGAEPDGEPEGEGWSEDEDDLGSESGDDDENPYEDENGEPRWDHNLMDLRGDEPVDLSDVLGDLDDDDIDEDCYADMNYPGDYLGEHASNLEHDGCDCD